MISHIQRTTFKVSDFINWQKYKSLVLSPKFQRRSVWNPGAKSYLIDTILNGLPIPVIILRDIKTDLNSFDSKKEVVDGQQRLRTIICYVAPSLIPEEDTFKVKAIHNSLAGGKTFDQLSNDLKQTILDYEFFVHVLPANTSDREILEIFSRMNSTGFKLNSQELRNAEYYGEFKTLAYNTSLELYDFWINAGILTNAKISRMQEVEVMNDLFTIVMSGLIDRSPKIIDGYYEKYDAEFLDKDEIVNRIKSTIHVIDSLVGKELKKLAFNKPQLFYALFAVIYDIRYGLKSSLKKTAPKKINTDLLKNNIIRMSRQIDQNRIPDKVFISLTKGTNRLNARKNVFDFLKKGLLNGHK